MKIPASIKKVIKPYVRGLKQSSAPVLDELKHDFKPEDRAALIAGFAGVRKSNSLSKTLAIAILIITFGFTLYFALLYKNDIKSVSFILGGNFLSLLVIAGWLRRVWLEGTTLDILTILIESMEPEEGARVITTFYFSTINNKYGQPPSARDTASPLP